MSIDTKKTKPVCSRCGSDEVLADAYASWDMDSQEWEVSNTFDKGSVCEACGGECSLEWVEVTDKDDDDPDYDDQGNLKPGVDHG